MNIYVVFTSAMNTRNNVTKTHKLNGPRGPIKVQESYTHLRVGSYCFSLWL